MKRPFLLLFLIVPLIAAAQESLTTVKTAHQGVTQQGTAQPLDTIFVSHQAKSYLLFDQPVKLADVGNPTLYQVQIEGNSILVVATKDSVSSTPFYAVVGGEPFTARLQFHPNPEAFYDFRQQGKSSSIGVLTSQEQVLSRLQEFSSGKDLNFASTKENGIHLRLVGLMHDLSVTYLKFRVKNRTSLSYQTGFMGFEKLKRYRKGFLAKEQQARFPIEPITYGSVETVLPYSEHDLYYALPLQALARRETIIATLRESSGSRSISLKIPARLLRRADLF